MQLAWLWKVHYSLYNVTVVLAISVIFMLETLYQSPQSETSKKKQGNPAILEISYPIKVLTNMYSCSCIRKKIFLHSACNSLR